MFGSYTFPALFGPSRSFDINAIGRKLTAAEAVRTGFALQAFATHEEMLQHAIKVGAELSATNQFSVVEAKKLLREPIRKALWNANIQELANLNKVWKDPAFVERLQRYMNSIALKAKL
jgi:enoyl-CoA hydratase/carnithine racemase